MVSGLWPASSVSPSGLPRLWRSSRSHAPSVSAAMARARRLTRNGEDIEHASRCRLHRQVLDRIGKAERARWVARVHLRRYHRARPPADAGDHGDILAAIGSLVADRLADDSAARLEPPQLLAGARIDGFEPAVHRAVEND